MWSAAARIKVAKALGRHEVTVRRSGLTISCGTGDGQGSFCAIAGPRYEPELLWLLGQLQPGDTFVDVGANIGIYSLHAARCLAGLGTVFAIEPSPDALRIFKGNIESNGFLSTIIPIHAAASRAVGQLYLAGTPTKWNSLQLHEHPPGIPIEVTTVDEILCSPERRAHFHFLKIDAEGVETDVLEGAWDSIQISWPKIIFENSINRLDALPTDWLRQRGYTIYAADHRGQLAEVSSPNSASHTNLVAIHPRSRITPGRLSRDP
jgi:FkbM family methyltransferase